MINIIFICTGNTCRSPMAEFIFKNISKESGIKISSAGLNTQMGLPIAENAALALKRLDIETTKFKSQKATNKLLKKATHIICMTKTQKLTLGKRENVYCMSDFGGEDIADPYGGDSEEYYKTALAIQAACGEIYKFLKENHSW